MKKEIVIPVYYAEIEGREVIDIESIREEFEREIEKLEKKE